MILHIEETCLVARKLEIAKQLESKKDTATAFVLQEKRKVKTIDVCYYGFCTFSSIHRVEICELL